MHNFIRYFTADKYGYKIFAEDVDEVKLSIRGASYFKKKLLLVFWR